MLEKLDFVILSTTTANNQSSIKVGSTLVKHVIYHCFITCSPLRFFFFFLGAIGSVYFFFNFILFLNFT